MKGKNNRPSKSGKIIIFFVFSLFLFSCSLMGQERNWVRQGNVYSVTDVELDDLEDDIEDISLIISDVTQMVVDGSFEGLEQYIDPEEGLYVDLRAHRSYEQILEDLANPDSYLNSFFLNERGEDSIYYLLNNADFLELDFYFEAGARQCDVTIRPLKGIFRRSTGRPEMLNNMVFVYRDGWKMAQIF